MNYSQLICETKAAVRYITINRESKLNALNQAVLQELSAAIGDASADDTIRAVLITGAGEKAFVAGADIAEFQDYSSEQGRELASRGQASVFNAIEACPKPVLAAINGFALGGGLELAMACHIRVAAENARLGLPEVTLGLIPGYGGTQRLTQLVGKGHAIEMITTADMVSAARALEIGLVNHVVPQAELIAKAEEILGKITQRAPLAVAAALKAVHAGLNNPGEGYATEIDSFATCFDTADFKEGVNAFFAKRKPGFEGK